MTKFIKPKGVYVNLKPIKARLTRQGDSIRELRTRIIVLEAMLKNILPNEED